MKAVAPHDRPREKLERLCAAALGASELLALVLGSGSRELDALALANRLLEQSGGLHGLTRTGMGALRHVGGIGQARAAQVLAAGRTGPRNPGRRRPGAGGGRAWTADAGARRRRTSASQLSAASRGLSPAVIRRARGGAV